MRVVAAVRSSVIALALALLWLVVAGWPACGGTELPSASGSAAPSQVGQDRDVEVASASDHPDVPDAHPSLHDGRAPDAVDAPFPPVDADAESENSQAQDVLDSKPCLSSGECDDGLFCTGQEECIGGVCGPGTDPCEPIGCLSPICQELPLPSCKFRYADDTTCDDHNACNGVETCDGATKQCISAQPLACTPQQVCHPTCGCMQACIGGVCPNSTDKCVAGVCRQCVSPSDCPPATPICSNCGVCTS